MSEQHPARTSAGLLLWLLFGLACIPGLGFFTWLIAAPVFLVTFILSIVIMASGKPGGISLLFMTLIGAPVLIFVAPFISTAVVGALLPKPAPAPLTVATSHYSAVPVAAPAASPAPTPGAWMWQSRTGLDRRDASLRHGR